jgi:hypothetical protein
VTGIEHSLTSDTASAWESTPWRAVQVAARDAQCPEERLTSPGAPGQALDERTKARAMRRAPGQLPNVVRADGVEDEHHREAQGVHRRPDEREKTEGFQDDERRGGPWPAPPHPEPQHDVQDEPDNLAEDEYSALGQAEDEYPALGHIGPIAQQQLGELVDDDGSLQEDKAHENTGPPLARPADAEPQHAPARALPVLACAAGLSK